MVHLIHKHLVPMYYYHNLKLSVYYYEILYLQSYMHLAHQEVEPSLATQQHLLLYKELELCLESNFLGQCESV